MIFDISSDEETCNEEPRNEDYSWISELLKDDRDNDDSDEVMVVGEVFAKQHLKSSFKYDGDDDDCVVLDGDPDKSVTVVNDDAAKGSDELLIVGEKGQIACRDYPHPRHLCVKFPFGTTPHETYCEQCHCYVCDSLAPCLCWGTGISVIDHCHATDKEEIWKSARKNFKLEKSGPLSVSQFHDASLSRNLAQTTQYKSLPSIPVCRPNAIRACSSSTNFGVPNIISQGRSQRSGPVLPKNRFPSHRLVSQQLHGVRHNVSQRDKVRSVGSLGHQFVSKPTMFKRAGSVGDSFTVDQSRYGSQYDINHRAYASQHTRNVPPTATSIDKNLRRLQDSHCSTNFESDTYVCPLTNMGSVFANTLPPQPSLYSQPASQPNDTQIIYQHGNQAPFATDSSLSDFGLGLVDNTIQSNQQSQIENTQLLSADPPKAPSLVSDFNSQLPGSVNPSSLYFDFEDWLLENQSVPGDSQADVPSEANILSPENVPIDAGLLYFDFETSWNGLHA